MSHSQFRCIVTILRHAWLNLQVQHILLAGSTRLLRLRPRRGGVESSVGLSLPEGICSGSPWIAFAACQYHLKHARGADSTGQASFPRIPFDVDPSEGAIQPDSIDFYAFFRIFGIRWISIQ